MMGITIREMLESDLVLVAGLEKRAYQYPWSERNFVDSLVAGDDCWVLIVEEQVAAYGIIMVAADDATVLNIVVSPEFRRQGLGRQLLEFLLTRARKSKALNCFLEVRRSNQAAISMYQQYGFVEVGCRRNYYQAELGREDALVLQLQLNPENAK